LQQIVLPVAADTAPQLTGSPAEALSTAIPTTFFLTAA